MRASPRPTDDGSASTLISQRDDGVIKELTASGTLRDAGTVAGVVHAGEGGLLGLEAWYEGETTWIYAYYTSATDNRIVRMKLNGTPGHYSLGAQQDILTGLAKAGNHDGGRIKFGPDKHLYATVGDAGQGSRAQDKNSLNGKILRMNLDGSVPDDNPFPGSLVYSLGHRNPQGIAWDSEGRMWASEFGQNTWDELNIISPGQNYGWPIHRGHRGRRRLRQPGVPVDHRRGEPERPRHRERHLVPGRAARAAALGDLPGGRIGGRR